MTRLHSIVWAVACALVPVASWMTLALCLR